MDVIYFVIKAIHALVISWALMFTCDENRFPARENQLTFSTYTCNKVEDTYCVYLPLFVFQLMNFLFRVL